MRTKVFRNGLEVGNRLRDLGLKREQVVSIAHAMIEGRDNTTMNDPSSTPGFFSWSYGTRKLREELLPHGWKRAEIAGVPLVFHEDKKVSISVMNTDRGTGLENSFPQPCNRKGPATRRAVDENQMEFLQILKESLNSNSSSDAPNSGIFRWYLCVYQEGDIKRAELSCPIETSEGYFSAFRERIIIALDGNGQANVSLKGVGSGEENEFDIPVTRKKVS